MNLEVIYHNVVFPIPAFITWSLIALFTYILHLEVKKFMRSFMSPKLLVTVSSYKLSLITASVLAFAVAPIMASKLLHLPGLYFATIYTLMLISVIRPYLLERDV